MPPVIRASTERLFRLWHDGVPSKVVSVDTNWAPHYGYMGVMTEIDYWSRKWSSLVKSPQNDIPAEYRHPYEGRPCHVWGAMHDGRKYNAGTPFHKDMPQLADLLELHWEDADTGEFHEVIFGRGKAFLCAIDGRRIAVVDPREMYVPIILTNTRVTAGGIDDHPL